MKKLLFIIPALVFLNLMVFVTVRFISDSEVVTESQQLVTDSTNTSSTQIADEKAPESVFSSQASAALGHHPKLLTIDMYSRIDPEVLKEAKSLANRNHDALIEEPQNDGSVMLRHSNSFQQVPVAVINSDGSISVTEF